MTSPWGKYTLLQFESLDFEGYKKLNPLEDVNRCLYVQQEMCYSNRFVDKETLKFAFTVSAVWLIVSVIFYGRQSHYTIPPMVCCLISWLLLNPKGIENLAEKIVKKILY